MASVEIDKVTPESCNFHLHPLPMDTYLSNQHHSEVRTDLARSRKQLQQFIRPGRSGHVEILRRTPQQQVTHAAAGKIRHISGGAQTRHNGYGKFLTGHASILIRQMPHANLIKLSSLFELLLVRSFD